MMRRAFEELWPAAVSIVGAITANQEQIEFWIRCGAGVVAIIAGCLSIYRFFHPNPHEPRRKKQ